MLGFMFSETNEGDMWFFGKRARKLERESKIVYDFMYHDARRVASFISQMEPGGHLLSMKQSSQEMLSKSNRRLYSGSFSSMFGLKADLEKISGGQSIASFERVYDPLWGNAINFIKYLEGMKLIHESIHNANIGQFVSFSGILKILDLKMLKDAWGMPNVISQIIIGNTSSMTEQQIKENELASDIIKLFPLTLQAYMYEPGENFSASWMNLDPECMVVPADNIIMKYGVTVQGTWKVIGIKDAYVDTVESNDLTFDSIRGRKWEDIASERHSTVIAIFAEILSSMARKGLGRPKIYYGITPILIYREITPNMAE
ncbi:hypothetical protein UCD39_15685 [Nitrospirillum sp. BR 11752]|uniref:hypothetical protein n=1 Tax=Nitrospirillum sp. BR 11752 TaxID=3104293 RepID=UPI002EC984BA|nr:hypothetical protein [Nitrospirillum sp. BR 11752]